MKIGLGVTPDLVRLVEKEYLHGERAVTRTMRDVSRDLKTKWRGHIAARLGHRMGNTVKSAAWPKATESMNAAAMVWTRAPQIVAAHEQGTTIRSGDGFFLAIPTPEAGRGLKGRRITPGEWERRTGIRLRFIYRRRAASLLVAGGVRINRRGRAVISRSKTGRNQVTAPIFILVPQVRLRKRLSLVRLAEDVAGTVPARIVANWDD